MPIHDTHYRMVNTEPIIRDSVVDGIFYPGEKTSLQKRVDDLLARTQSAARQAFALIAPHAGYDYAGPLIAEAFAAAAGRQVDTVVVLAPIHRDAGQEIALPESHGFKTPLGVVPVDQLLVEDLLHCNTGFIQYDIPHLEEHSIEVHLPFMQSVFPGAKLLPILVGRPNDKMLGALIDALKLTFRERFGETLFIASSNMCTFEPAEKAEEYTDRLLALIELSDWQGILSAYRQGSINPCGALCIATVLALGETDHRVEVLGKGDSSRVNKDNRRCIHYAAVAVISEDTPAP